MLSDMILIKYACLVDKLPGRCLDSRSGLEMLRVELTAED